MTRANIKNAIISEDMKKYSFYKISKIVNIPVSTLYKWQNTMPANKKEATPLHRKDYSIIIEEIKKIKTKHPYFGYRRVYAYLKHRLHYHIKRNTVYILMKENKLLQKPNQRRKSYKNKDLPEVSGANQMWQIDMTYGYLTNGTPIYSVGIIDVYTRELVALTSNYRARSNEWLLALDEAIKRKFPDGKADNLIIGSDNGCQPTSKNFRDTCSLLNISIHYTGYKNPKENGYIERFFRTLKEECIWLNDFETFDEYNNELSQYMDYYNKERMHSSLNYQSPYEYLEKIKFGKNYEKCYN